jgi:hypothetical protein
MIDGDECGAVGGMRIGRGNRSTRRKPVPAPLCPPKIPYNMTWARTWAAAVGSQWLTAWAMARPYLLTPKGRVNCIYAIVLHVKVIHKYVQKHLWSPKLYVLKYLPQQPICRAVFASKNFKLYTFKPADRLQRDLRRFEPLTRVLVIRIVETEKLLKPLYTCFQNFTDLLCNL